MPKKKKAKKKPYFGIDVQEAIVRYNALDQQTQEAKRNKIYREEIHKAFDKLAENIINTFKFSYFSVVAKNYLILHNNNNYKKLKSHSTVDALDKQRSFNSYDKTDMKELTGEIVDYFEVNLSSIFKKQRDLNIAYSILDLMKHIDEIENFNKKALYILIREMTDVETSHITSVVNTLKKHYKKITNEYYTKGIITISKSGSFF